MCGETLAQQVGAYHARQRELLQQRAEQRERLKDIDLKALLPSKSLLDQSMSRKTARGGHRPNYPLLLK